MKKKLSILLVISMPILVAIYDFRIVTDAINSILEFIGVNTKGTHFSVGDFIRMMYIICAPIAQLFILMKKPRLNFTSSAVLMLFILIQWAFAVFFSVNAYSLA